MKNLIENFLAKCVCKGIELYMRKYRIYMSNEELIPMTDEKFKEELVNHNSLNFCENYFERYDKYRNYELSEKEEYIKETNLYVSKM